jgi:hypothetical protein
MNSIGCSLASSSSSEVQTRDDECCEFEILGAECALVRLCGAKRFDGITHETLLPSRNEAFNVTKKLHKSSTVALRFGAKSGRCGCRGKSGTSPNYSTTEMQIKRKINYV